MAIRNFLSRMEEDKSDLHEVIPVSLNFTISLQDTIISISSYHQKCME